ncbi:MAG: signal transduction histidine kinase/CheY-like chemotaxis protein [Halioglobus sp.]|jgi:signal transduction histidine kinase/CheY-like chemotaxis protein
MQLSIGQKIFFGLMASVILLVVTVNVALYQLLKGIGQDEVIRNLERGIEEYSNFDRGNQKLMISQVENLANTPFLKATFDIPRLDSEAASYALSQLQLGDNKSRLLLFDKQQKLLAGNLPDTKITLQLSSIAGSDTLKSGRSLYSTKVLDGKLYRLASTAIFSSARVVGTLVIAKRLDTAEAISSLRSIVGIPVALAFSNQLILAPEQVDGPSVRQQMPHHPRRDRPIKKTQGGIQIYAQGLEGTQYYFAEIPLGPDGIITFAGSTNVLPATAKKINWLIFLGSALGIVLTTIFSFWVASRISGPVRRLTTAAECFGAGDMTFRVEVDSKDDLGTLGKSFNHMADTIQKDRADLVETQKAAEAANIAKSTFLATMSHEIRTPLNGVLGMTELIADELEDTEHAESLNIIKDSGQSLLKIIDQVLDFSRLEAGKLDLELNNVDLMPFMQNICSSHAVLAKAKGLDFIATLPHEIELNIVTDEVRLRGVLTNLIGNAMKFTAEGSIVVRASLVEQMLDRATICFEVCDTGIGITPEKIETVFSSFSQADSTTTREYGGTGLGLAIAKQLVELMGGQIQLTSAVGEGSRFSFELRFGVNEATTIEALETENSDNEKQRETFFRNEDNKSFATGQFQGRRILVVEDDAVNRDVAGAMLLWFGCETLYANNGEEAVEMIQSGSYDLVLMDCQMPVMDGFEATRNIRARELEQGTTKIPIVALTANAVRGDREACLAAGMDDYISKPFDLQLLGEKLQMWSAS